MKPFNPFFLILGLVFVFSAALQAQEPVDTLSQWRVETKDGNEYVGKLIAMDSQKVVLLTQVVGRVEIPRAFITAMTRIQAEQMIEGEFWFENPQATRYFWSPNGYGLHRGEGYYQNVWIFFNQISVGVTENFSIGAGLIPLFLFGGASTPVWITPKFSVPVVPNKFNLGGGALVGTVIGEEDASFGIAYGISTFGSRDKNFSAGIGYGFAGGEWANVPTIALSAMIRTGRKGYFLTENYLIDTGDSNLVILSLGGRTVWTKIALDYGLILPIGGDIGTFVGIPWLGLILPFGSQR